jgi:glycosyltransferase involved in cell wall biosynthesis
MPIDISITREQKKKIRREYGIPPDTVVFIYGGNLGKPQGLDFLLSILQVYKNIESVFFLIVGDGTEYAKIAKAIVNTNISNAQLIQSLPKNKYDRLLSSCDVGLIFLDPKFTIPNFPSRLLSYLECKVPVIAATDKNTDIGTIMDSNHFGRWVVSGQLEAFKTIADAFIADSNLRTQLGLSGYRYMMKHYLVENSYKIIMKHFPDV